MKRDEVSPKFELGCMQFHIENYYENGKKGF